MDKVDKYKPGTPQINLQKPEIKILKWEVKVVRG